MALADEVQSRYSTARLVQLTRHDDEDASTVNTTTLGFAATDVEADFKIVAGVAYDNTDPRHVAVGVEGVVAKLYQRKEAPGEKADKRHDAYVARLKALARVTGRNRVVPETNSRLTPSKLVLGRTHRPDTDREHFDDVVLDPPRSADSDDRTN